MSAPVLNAVRESRVLVCVGAGGVGKTTVSASLALSGALAGRRSLVCTIDPARRLANALGLTGLGNAEARIPPEALQKAGLPADLPLWAMMLDMKQSWDELIGRLLPSPQRERVLQNRFYQSLSTALAGSQEYIALDKLHRLAESKQYDLLVLDTPPTAHAIDFLEAPKRVLDFLDNEAARWLLTPALAAGKVSLQLLNLGGSYAAKTLSKLTGAETLSELAQFMLSISGMNSEFRERAQRVTELLKSASTRFVVVTTPTEGRMAEVSRLRKLLDERHLHTAAVIANRVQKRPSPHAFARAEALPPPLREKMVATLQEASSLADSDEATLAELKVACAPVPIAPLARVRAEVHDLAGLSDVARGLSQPSQGEKTG
jgi:anion-transporting  ArsA/GET3 family ATPase